MLDMIHNSVYGNSIVNIEHENHILFLTEVTSIQTYGTMYKVI